MSRTKHSDSDKIKKYKEQKAHSGLRIYISLLYLFTKAQSTCLHRPGQPVHIGPVNLFTQVRSTCLHRPGLAVCIGPVYLLHRPGRLDLRGRDVAAIEFWAWRAMEFSFHSATSYYLKAVASAADLPVLNFLVRGQIWESSMSNS